MERTHNLIRKIATDLLSLHPPELSKEKTSEIVELLTVGMYSHEHVISRKEAKQLGLNVKIADKEVDALLWNLFEHYSSEMELEKPFNPPQMVVGQTAQGVQSAPLRISATRAFIESAGRTDAFVSEGTISRGQPGAFQLPPGVQIPPQLAAQVQVTVQFSFEGWKVLR